MSPIKTDYAAQICKQFRGNYILFAIAFCSKSSWPNKDFFAFMPKEGRDLTKLQKSKLKF